MAFHQNAVFQQPAAVPQPSNFQQPSAQFQQASAMRPAAIYQQPSAIQQNAAYQQPRVYQQSQAYQQPQVYQQPQAHQQPQVYQQPLSMQQQSMIAASQRQSVGLQNTSTTQQRVQKQRPHSMSLASLQQPSVLQQAPTIHHSHTFHPNTGVQQPHMGMKQLNQPVAPQAAQISTYAQSQVEPAVRPPTAQSVARRSISSIASSGSSQVSPAHTISTSAFSGTGYAAGPACSSCMKNLFKDDHPFECLSCAASNQSTLFCQKCFVTDITHAHDRSDFICDQDGLWLDNNFQAYGWDVRKTASGRTWYHHKATNKKTFNPPIEAITAKSQAQPQPQAQTVPQPNLQPQVRLQVQPQVQPKVRPKVQPQLQPQLQSQVQPQVQPEYEPHQLKLYLGLPSEWDELRDPDGRTFYRHRRTHQATWWRPSSKNLKLIEGWVELRNPDGRPYYFHAASQTTTWDHPGISSLAKKGYMANIKTSATSLAQNKKAQKIAATLAMGVVNGVLKDQCGFSLGNGLVKLVGNEKQSNANKATAVTRTTANVVGQIVGLGGSDDSDFEGEDVDLDATPDTNQDDLDATPDTNLDDLDETPDMSLDQSQDVALDPNQDIIQDVSQDGFGIYPTDGAGFGDSETTMEYDMTGYVSDQSSPIFTPTIDFQPPINFQPPTNFQSPVQNNIVQHNLRLGGLQNHQRPQNQGPVRRKLAGNTAQTQNPVIQGNNLGANVAEIRQQAATGNPVLVKRQSKEGEPSGPLTARAHAQSHSNTNGHLVQPTNNSVSNTGRITTNPAHTPPHGPPKPTVTNYPPGSAATSGNQAPGPTKPYNPLTTQAGTQLMNSANLPQARPNQMAVANTTTTPALNQPGRIPANNSNTQKATRPNAPGANSNRPQRPNLQPQSLGQQRPQAANQRPPGGLSNTSQNAQLANATLQFATAIAQGLSKTNDHTAPVNNSRPSASNNTGNFATNQIASTNQVVSHATQHVSDPAGTGNEARSDQPQQINVSDYQELNQSIDQSLNLSMDQNLNQNINQDINLSVDQINHSINQNINQNKDQGLRNYEIQGVSLVQDSTGDYENQENEEVGTEGQESGGQGQYGEVYDGSGEVYNYSGDTYNGGDGGMYDESGTVYTGGADDVCNGGNGGEVDGGDNAYDEVGEPDTTHGENYQDQGQGDARDQQNSYVNGTDTDQLFDCGADESDNQGFTVDCGYYGGGDSGFVIDSSFVPDQYDDSQDNCFDPQDNFQYGDDSYESKPIAEPSPPSKVNVSIGIDVSQPTLDRGIVLPLSVSSESSIRTTIAQQEAVPATDSILTEQITAAATETTTVAASPVATVTSLSAGEPSQVDSITFASLSGPLTDYDYYEPFEPTYDDLPSKSEQHELGHGEDTQANLPAELANSEPTGLNPIFQPLENTPTELAASESRDPPAKDNPSPAQYGNTSTAQSESLRKQVTDSSTINNSLVPRQAESISLCESEPPAQIETILSNQPEDLSQQNGVTPEMPIPPAPAEPQYTPFRPPKPEFILPTMSEPHYTAFRPAQQPVIDEVQAHSQYTAFRPQETAEPQPEPQYTPFQPPGRPDPLGQHRHSMFQFRVEPPLTEPNREAAYDRGSPTPTVSSISSANQDIEPSALSKTGVITPISTEDPEKYIASTKEKPAGEKRASVPDYDGSGYGDSDFVPPPQFSAFRG